MRSARYIKTKESLSQTELKLNPLECKVQDDFTQLKQNILKIPEFWTDADQTVKNILKNAVNIVTKQYPTADVEAFEMEIQNILKTTEAIKQEILTKTEEIVTEANRIYEKGYEAEGPTDEELKLITEKMEELRNNVNEKNNAFCDLLKCGNELKQIGEMKNLLKVDEKLIKENIKNRKDQLTEGKMTEKRKTQRRIGKNRSKSRIQIDNENILSCGDILRQDAKAVIRLLNDSGTQMLKINLRILQK